MKKDNELLYAFEGMASLFVILIHCPFPGLIGQGCIAIARFAVPLFFAISGYFLVGKETLWDEKVVKRKLVSRIKRQAIGLAMVWLVYAIYACLLFIMRGETGLLG